MKTTFVRFILLPNDIDNSRISASFDEKRHQLVIYFPKKTAEQMEKSSAEKSEKNVLESGKHDVVESEDQEKRQIVQEINVR